MTQEKTRQQHLREMEEREQEMEELRASTQKKVMFRIGRVVRQLIEA